MSDLEKNLDELVAAALKEDVGDGDRTTAYLVEKGLKGIARITAKEDLVLAGYLPVQKVFASLNSEIKVSFPFDEGTFVKQGELVCEIWGPFDLLLT